MITILTGNVLDTLPTLPSNSVQCCVTSPPYWGLRSYLPDGHADKGFELGSEATPQEYVANMVRVFAEVKRVLREDGVCFLNLGDSYVGGGGFCASAPSSGHSLSGRYGNSGALIRGGIKASATLKPKDLCGIPWRVAFALQEDGWWLRSEITWCKKAPMPESVTDRPTSATEKIFLLTKSARYFYDAQAVAEQATATDIGATGIPFGGVKYPNGDMAATYSGNEYVSTGTRNQRNFWLLGPEPYAEAHFATFPTEIPRRAILAGTSAYGACPTCGAPWIRAKEVAQCGAPWYSDKHENENMQGVQYRETDGSVHAGDAQDLQTMRGDSAETTSPEQSAEGVRIAQGFQGKEQGQNSRNQSRVSKDGYGQEEDVGQVGAIPQIRKGDAGIPEQAEAILTNRSGKSELPYSDSPQKGTAGESRGGIYGRGLGDDSTESREPLLLLQPSVYDSITADNRPRNSPEQGRHTQPHKHSGGVPPLQLPQVESLEAGWQPTCTCGHEDTVPCVVLDPFTGSGTTGAVARTLGRSFIGCELNPEYVKLAEKRIGHAQPALFGI